MRFSTGRNFFTRALILSERKRNESRREDIRSQPEFLELVRSKVDEQITVRLSRRVLICFDGKCGLVGIHLSRQAGKLTRVSRILEEPCNAY